MGGGGGGAPPPPPPSTSVRINGVWLYLVQGAPNVNFWKISVRKKIWDLEFLL